MLDLCDLTCEACRADAPKASASEQEAFLKDIDGWVINTDPCDMLVKKYSFESYEEAVSFTNAIAEMSETEGHHPKIILEWGLVTIVWWSHKINGLHKNDFICASKTDSLYQYPRDLTN